MVVPSTFTLLAQVRRIQTGISLEDTTQYTLGTSIARGIG